MKITKTNYFIVFLFSFTCWIFAQTQADADFIALESQIHKALPKRSALFNKALYFFVNKKRNAGRTFRDSAYVYSGLALDEKDLNTQGRHYLSYIRGNTAKRKKLYTETLERLAAIPDTFAYHYLVRIDLGKVFFDNKDYNKALAYWTSPDLTTQIKSRKRLSKHYNNIGLAHLLLENYPDSKKNLQLAMKMAIEMKDTLSVSYITSDMAQWYYVQRIDDQAFRLHKEADSILKSSSKTTIDKKADLTYNSAIYARDLKRYKESTDFFIEAKRLSDSAFAIQNNVLTNKVEEQKRLAIKDKEILLADQKASKQEARANNFIIALLVVGIFLAVLFYFYRSKIAQNNLINTQKKALEESNTTKNYLFSVLSHDLRSPVNTLVLMQHKLLYELDKQDLEAAKATAKSYSSLSTGLQGLLDNVLHWSLDEKNGLTFKKEKLLVLPIVNDILSYYQLVAEAKTIHIHSNIDAGSSVQFDKNSFQIIIRNLLDNAIKYTPEDGELKITADRSATGEEITITNSGKGIPELQLKQIQSLHVLDKEQLDRAKGVGLGLILCYTLSKQNNALLQVDNISTGTRVRLTIPV
ncbi:MAG: HAMP domain-containing histidine kinase [Flavobacteriaceae bacterium]|nr:HAMP domain-containing histidine kinase [Flavobacteriaceae bacterium]